MSESHRVRLILMLFCGNIWCHLVRYLGVEGATPKTIGFSETGSGALLQAVHFPDVST